MQQTHVSVTNSHSGIMSVPECCVDVALCVVATQICLQD